MVDLPKIKQMAAKNNVTIIGISQIRDKIKQGYGADATTTVQGGKACDSIQFYICV